MMNLSSDKIRYLISHTDSAYRVVYRKLTNKTAPRRKINGKKLLSEEETNRFISESITAGKPLMVARYGSTEIQIINKYLSKEFHIINKYPLQHRHNICMYSGFFPNEENRIDEFCRLMLKSSSNLDLIGLWNDVQETYIVKTYAGSSQFCDLRSLEPFYNPAYAWTKALKGKKVLVIHPFEQSIQKQYKNRSLIFEDEILPEFDLITLKAVQTIAGEKDQRFETWFDALHYMEQRIVETDFDVALLGCGAYGFPLASYIKSIGKQAIHMGGSTQLLFGIKGKRWDIEGSRISKLFNEYWVYPTEEERPKQAKVVEGGCYW